MSTGSKLLLVLFRRLLLDLLFILILLFVLIIVLIIEVLIKVVIIVKVLVLERLAGEVVDRTWNDLCRMSRQNVSDRQAKVDAPSP